MMPAFALEILLALLAAGAVAAVRVFSEKSLVVEAKRLPPPRASPPPPARTEDFGVDTCTFGIASHCYWRPVKVQPKGLNRFEWGFCLARWKDDLYAKEKDIAWVNSLVNAILAVVNVLTAGLSKEAIERLCLRFYTDLRSYSVDGVTYWGTRYVDPQRHIRTGEVVKPPPNPKGTGYAWIHEQSRGRLDWPVPVFALFFADGAYREVVSTADLRTLLRDGNITVGVLADIAGSIGEKARWALTTKSKAEGMYR